MKRIILTLLAASLTLITLAQTQSTKSYYVEGIRRLEAKRAFIIDLDTFYATTQLSRFDTILVTKNYLDTTLAQIDIPFGCNNTTQLLSGDTIIHDVNNGVNALVVLTEDVGLYYLYGLSDGCQGDILVIENDTGGYGILNIVHDNLTVVYPDPDEDNTGNKPVAANINSQANRKTVISYHRVNDYLLITYGKYAE